MKRQLTRLTMICVTWMLVTQVRAEVNWPRWRGPEGTGISSQRDLPVQWGAGAVRWRAALPGQGQSSPVLWEDRIFLTAAVDEGKGRVVICLDRETGKLRWQQTAWRGEAEETHSMNPWASATCATDGERVVAFFGNGGLHCYDVDGKHLWSRDLGTFASPWGTAASPIIVGDLVVQNCDADNRAFLLAVDKRTGETVWQTEREAYRGWSTPIVIEADGRRELVLNGHTGLHAYDPATGKPLWFCPGDNGRGSPSVVYGQGLLVAVGGRSGDMIAVPPGGQGTVEAAWRVSRQGGRDLPSPVIAGRYLFVVNLRPGIGTCYDVRSGRELWRRRMGGNFTASPIAAGELVYVTNEDGETTVLRLGADYEEVARNASPAQGDEIFRASAAAGQGRVFLRSNTALYCIE